MYYNFIDVLFSLLRSERLPTPICLTSLWNVGFLLILLTLFQIISGFYLTFYIKVGVQACLMSKMFIIKEVSFGWFNSFLHSIIPSILFFYIYLHIFRSLLHPVYSFVGLWSTGIIIYLVYCSVSFTGYCLVGGSMSYWALVVFRNILSYVVGEYISFIIMLDVINDFTFIRVFSYHFTLGVLVLLTLFTHVKVLHGAGSSMGFSFSLIDSYSFRLVLLIKDLLGFNIMIVGIFAILGFHFENYSCFDTFSEIDVSSVPEDISPEWFLRLFFVILKSIYSKFLGILAMISVVVIFLIKPFLRSVFGSYLVGGALLIFIILGGYSVTLLQFYGGKLTISKIIVLIGVVSLLDLEIGVQLSSILKERGLVLKLK